MRVSARISGPRSVVVLAAWMLLAAPALAQNHPFGTHPFTYAAGSIVPNHVNQSVLDQAVRDFYDAWKQRFIEQDCGPGRYVVLTDVQAGNLTVSEGHGYGMILMALMAGHDPDAHAIFDGMYSYFREHPTATHSHLMAWNQNKSCHDVDGNDSASDGDLDIAFALLLADKQWGSCGAIDYHSEALAVIADLADGDVDPSGRYVMLGDWVTPDDAQYFPSTRSSDFMTDHYRSYAAAAGGTPWNGLLNQTYAIVDSMQTNHSPTTGLLPDFVIDPLGTPAPAGPNFLESDNDGAYDYNACRDPWRLGTDFLVAGEPRAKTAVQRINTWIRSKTGGNPANIQSGYQLNGTVSHGADYLSMAFVAPLGVGAMVDASNQAWLNALWDLIVGTPADVDGYYENTLKMLSMVVMSGNWWVPEAVSGGCTSTSTPLCTNGGYLSGQITLRGLGAGVGKQALMIKGGLFFPQGNPAAAPYTDGAQILLEDLGNGGAEVFDVSRLTTPVPPVAQGGCAGKDAWSVKSTRTMYRNRSGALDPPVCTAGSARGLQQLKYRPESMSDLDIQLKVRHSTIATPVGPLRATVVLGSTQAAGDAGACAVSPSLVCDGGGSTLRCQ